MIFLSLSGKNAAAPELFDKFSKTDALSTLEPSLTGKRRHANLLTKIIFTIHIGLATVNLAVIIDCNQMLNPSAVRGC